MCPFYKVVEVVKLTETEHREEFGQGWGCND